MLRLVTFELTSLGQGLVRVNPKHVSALLDSNFQNCTHIAMNNGSSYEVRGTSAEVEEQLLGGPLERLAETAREE